MSIPVKSWFTNFNACIFGKYRVFAMMHKNAPEGFVLVLVKIENT